MASYIDINGQVQQLNLEPTIYRQAADRGMTVRQMINVDHPVQQGSASAWDQVCASEGMFSGRDNDYGIAPATMDAILNGRPQIEGASIVRDAIPASRILFPMFQMSAIEDRLRSSDYGALAMFNSAAAVVDTINADRFERPILNFSRPEGARSKAIAQLSEPASMLSNCE